MCFCWVILQNNKIISYCTKSVYSSIFFWKWTTIHHNRTEQECYLSLLSLVSQKFACVSCYSFFVSGNYKFLFFGGVMHSLVTFIPCFMKIGRLFRSLKRALHRQTQPHRQVRIHRRRSDPIRLQSFLWEEIRLKCLAAAGALSNKYALCMYESSDGRRDTRQMKGTCAMGRIRRSSCYVDAFRRPINLTHNPPRLSAKTLISSSFD